MNGTLPGRSVVPDRRGLLVGLLLVLAPLAVYWQVFDYRLVILDNLNYIVFNRAVQEGLSLKGVVWAFTTTHGANWHPVTWLSHMLDIQLFGMNPGMFHSVNLMLHIANTLLLYLVLENMTRDVWKAALVAALFAVHPQHVESVAWVAERKDVLSTLFFFLTIASYLRYLRRRRGGTYGAVFVCFALGLLSKPMLVTLPFVLLLLDFWPLGRFHGQRRDGGGAHGCWPAAARLVVEKVPLFVLSGLTCAMTLYAPWKQREVGFIDGVPFGLAAANALVSIVKYLVQTVFPAGLAAIYPFPDSVPSGQVVGAGLLLAAVTVLVGRSAGRRPYLAVGWFWFLGTLVPVLGLVHIGPQSMADRYTYIPHVGLFAVAAWGVPELASSWRHRSAGLACAAAASILLFGAVAWRQVGYWRESTVLFRRAIAVTDDNYFAYFGLGVVAQNKGRLHEAIGYYEQALDIRPDDLQSSINLGLVFAKSGRFAEAIELFIAALQVAPDSAKVHANLGKVLGEVGRTEEAVYHLEQALRTAPRYRPALLSLSALLHGQGRETEAKRYFMQAIGIDPDAERARERLEAFLSEQRPPAP